MAQILIIDDDSLVRRALRKLLEYAGYEVIEAADGIEGVSFYEQHEPDLIISDIFMPKKEGLETISELRSKHPKVKIIAISGGGLPNQVNFLPTAELLGAIHTLSKPFKSEELLTVIGELLKE